MTTITETKAIAQEVNLCLSRHRLTYSPTFDFNDFRTTKNVILNHSATNKLTDLILKNYFPQNPIDNYHHFTDIDAFESILTNKKLWLLSVAKRFSEDEFSSFYEAHNMDGYKKRISNGIPLEQELVKDAFYTSFTDDKLTSDEEVYMWRTFAKENGVRLVFKADNVNLDLRQVFYPPNTTDKDIKLLTDLISIASNRNKYLIIERLATIGFFYLPHKYNVEREFRLFIKRERAKDFKLVFNKHPTGFEYVEIPLNGTNQINLTLTKIIISKKTDRHRIDNLIANNPEFINVPIENNYS